MSQVREILTRAIVGKGKKRFTINEKILHETPAFSILGCWIINHQFEAKQQGDTVTITGQFEVNAWYSTDENKRTDVSRKVINYEKQLKTKQIVSDYLSDNTDVIVRAVQQPTCTEAKIIGDYIEVEVMFEMVAELIGETKMQVTVFDQFNNVISEDDLDDIDNEIDEDNIVF